MINVLGFLFTLLIFLYFSSAVFANSEYVLPYPSEMPGSKTYIVHLAVEKIQRYWYFGSIGQYKYNLKLADKYLVEAKTLFEYKQYKLAFYSLRKSDDYIMHVGQYLSDARREKKDIGYKMRNYRNAAAKHQEVLDFLLKILPDEYIWREENKPAEALHIKKAIELSIQIRKKIQQ